MPADGELMLSSDEANEWIREYEKTHGGESPPISAFVSEFPSWLICKRGGSAEMGEIRFYAATGEYGFLSNLYPCRIVYDDREFRSAEEAYQFGKPKDPEVAKWLVSSPAPRFCAIAAHALLSYDIKLDWQETKVERMKLVLRQKFEPGSPLAVKLMATGDAKLVEASKTDSFWGTGPVNKGKNTLGRLLMEERNWLIGYDLEGGGGP
jgi:ribA/ribD-fused uncharacterized protein